VKMSGDVYELACAVFDLTFGTGTLRKLIKLYLWHENATKELCDLKLFAKLDAREMSISKAYDLVVQFNKIAEERGKSPLADVKVFERKPKFKGADWELFYHSNQDLSILDDGQISTVVCSPPYFGVQANYKNAKKALGGKVQGEEKLMDEYIANQVLTYSGLKSKLKDDGSLFVVIGDAFQGRDLGVPEFLTVEMLKDGWKFQGKYIWCKNDQKPQQLKGRLLNTVEHVLHFTPSDDFKWNEFVNWTDEPIRLGRTSGKGYKDGVIRKGYYLERPIERFRNLIEEQNWVRVLKLNGFHKSEVSHVGRTNHPCPFPTNLAMFFIMLTTDIGDVVCDIYGGIGTVAYAAKVLHRRSISIDVDLEAIEFANKRLQLTEGDQISTEEELEELQLVFKGTAKKEWVKAA